MFIKYLDNLRNTNTLSSRSNGIQHGFLKKSFSILSLLAPPQDLTDSYKSFFDSSKNYEVESILDQPSKTRSSIKNDVFIKGRQENLNGAISFIENWSSMQDSGSQCHQPTPVIIHILSSCLYRLQIIYHVQSLWASTKSTKKVPLYSICVDHICPQYFSVLSKMAKNPHAVNSSKLRTSSVLKI